jgi:Rha family phage regulatory protein
MNNLVLAALRDNVPTTTSVVVAEAFGKRHDNVLRDIRTLRTTAPGSLLNFEESTRSGERRAEPCFIMDEKAFSILVMGFTGDDALEWKMKFYDAFAALRDNLLTLTPIEQAEHNLNQWKRSEQLRIEAEDKLTKVSALVPLLTPYYEAQKIIAASTACLLTSQAAKTLGISHQRLNQWLFDNDWLMRDHDGNRIPKQPTLNKGLMVLKYFDYENTQEYYDVYKIGYRPQPMLTSKGMELISRQMCLDNDE